MSSELRQRLIYVSTVLQRNPIILKRLTDFEQAYESYKEAFQCEKSKGFFEVQVGDAEDRAKANTFGLPTKQIENNEHLFKEDQSPISISRSLDRKLYLLSKYEEGWRFPFWKVESLEQPFHLKCQEELAIQFGEGAEYLHLGRAPIAHHVERFTDRTLPPFSAIHFFFKSQIISGRMTMTKEYGWFALEEIKNLVPKGYWGAVKDVLAD